jgi:hypothetical protein
MSDIWKIIIGTTIGTTLLGGLGEFLKDYLKDYFIFQREISKLRKEKIVEQDFKVGETLYCKIDELFLSMDLGSDPNFQSLLIGLEDYIQRNNLYVDRGLKSLCYETTDYIKQVTTDKIIRDLNMENEFLEKFKSKFRS